MLTYPCQTEILKFLTFEKRSLLAKHCPEIRNCHRILPFHLKNLEIYQLDYYFHLKVDDFDTWIYCDPAGFGNSEFKTCISHEKHAMDRSDSSGGIRRVKCHVEEVSQRILNYFLNRKGTKVENFTVKGNIQIPRQVPSFQKIRNLTVFSDDKIDKWFHVAKGNSLCHVTTKGRVIYDFLGRSEILNSERVTVATSSTNIQCAARRKLIKNQYLRFEFHSLLGRYHQLSEEIFEISLQNRPIGTVIDYYVHDYFNTKLYPNFAKIVSDLGAKRTKLDNGINAITIPMKNANLNVFIVPRNNENLENAWILRMAVMEKTIGKNL